MWHPHAHENIAADCPLLVLRLGEAELAGQSDQKLSQLAQQLLELPAVTAISTEGLLQSVFPSDELLAAFDIWLTEQPTDSTGALAATGTARPVEVADLPAAINNLSMTAQTSPQSAVSLVQLLRVGQHLSVRDALMSESWVYSQLLGGPAFHRWLSTSNAARPMMNTGSHSAVVEGFKPQPPVQVSRSDGALQLTFNRPERRNAFNSAMRDIMVETLRAARLDPPPGGITLSGAGENFCSGGDLDEFGTTPDPATAHIVRSLRSTAWEMHLLADQITARLHGACVGAGIELPCFTRRVVARPSAFFWLPEVRLGLVPGAGGTVSIPRRIGRQRACWMALSNQRIDPDTALAWGLIDEIEDW